MTTRKTKDNLAAWGFLFPAVALIGLFVLWPIVQLLWVSLHDWNILRDEMTWAAGENYGAVVEDAAFWQALWNTAVYVGVTVPVGMAVSLGLAMLLDDRVRAAGLFRTIVFTPVVTSMVAAGVVFVWLMDYDQGPINQLLDAVGIGRINWLQSERWAMPAVIVMTIWKQSGYNMILFLAGLQAIPETYYEAARIDGVRPGWQTFRYVTWPLLWPTTFFVLVVSVIFAFRAFEPMYVMTRGGPVGATTTLVYYIFDRAFRYGAMGEAAAVSAMMLAIVLAVTWVQLKLQRRWE